MTAAYYVAPNTATEPDVQPASAEAFAAWKARRSPRAYALEITSDSLAPALRKGWHAIAEPGRSPASGDWIAITFKTGQQFVLEFVRRTPQWVTACAPLARRSFRQFAMTDIAALDLVVAMLPPSEWQAHP